MEGSSIQNLAYLLASVLFILGIKGLTHPRTAVRGNLTSALAMLLAVVATLAFSHIISWPWIITGLVLGSVIGTVMAVKVPMTGMPQMVAIFNGFGGAASFFVAGAELYRALHTGEATTQPASEAVVQAGLQTQFALATAAAGLIGAVTLLGSFVAYAKLAEFSITLKPKNEGDKPRKIWLSNALLVPGRHVINAALAIICIALFVFVATSDSPQLNYWLLVAVAAILGVMITIPIGGADMPVVIALLNSYSGLAACATGFVINNNVLIIAGSLVGASGLILTAIMCKAMNRSLVNVIFATLGGGSDAPSADDVYAGKVKQTSAEEIAMLFDTAQRVVIVPGYGMAVSQAQHAVRELANLLEERDITVEFGIHPVAGRMPGHMNVLLAEANIDYDKLLEMDVINSTLETVDVCLVIGANDVVNPVAREEGSAISGMPIIDVDKCRTVVVIKRSLSPGFAGIPNPLFAADNCLMFFNDGKKAFTELIEAVKEG